MIRIALKITCITTIMAVIFSANLCAAENTVKDNAAAKKASTAKEGAKDTAGNKEAEREKGKKPFTDAEIAEHLTGMIEHEKDIINIIPGLKEIKDDKGKISYSYQGTSLDKLEREKLDKLNSKVLSEIGRIRAERISKQLESIRQAHQAIVQAQQAARPSVIPTSPPKAPYIPPQLPQNPNVAQHQNVYTPPVPFQPPSVVQPPNPQPAQAQAQQPPRQPTPPPGPPRR